MSGLHGAIEVMGKRTRPVIHRHPWCNGWLHFTLCINEKREEANTKEAQSSHKDCPISVGKLTAVNSNKGCTIVKAAQTAATNGSNSKSMWRQWFPHCAIKTRAHRPVSEETEETPIAHPLAPKSLSSQTESQRRRGIALVCNQRAPGDVRARCV